jgi:branched-chain amino acid transport system permease protein
MKQKTSFADSLMETVSENIPATIIILGTIALAVALGVVGTASQVIISIITGGMWALMAVGLALVFGVMNVPHFAHGESFMVGAYVAFYVFDPIRAYLAGNPNSLLGSLAPFIAILASGVAGAILGVILERLLFYPLRLRSKAGEWVMNAFLLTVGISFIMTNGTTLLIGPNFRGIPGYWDVDALQFLGARVSVDRVIAFFIALGSIVALWFFLRRTRTGRAIRAVSQDEVGAQMMGINLDFIYPLTFSLATAMAALAGGSLLFMFQAYPTVGKTPLYFAWFVVMMAGLGNVVGAIVGGFIVAVFQTATQQFVGIAWANVIPTALMIIVLLVVPKGIFGSDVGE